MSASPSAPSSSEGSTNPSSLTEDQINAVSMFQSVTNMEDQPSAISMLSEHQWNLETAIATALAIKDNQSTNQPISRPSRPITSTSRPINQPINQLDSQSSTRSISDESDTAPLLQSAADRSDRAAHPSRVTRPQSSNQSNNQSLSHTINQYPFGWILTGFIDLITTILSLVLPTGWIAGTQAVNHSQRRANQTSNQSLFRDLSTRFPDWPPFLEGTYPQAVRESKRQSKLLFIYLHDQSNNQCEQFINQTLATEDMCNFMRENFVGWMGDVNSADGARLKATLRVNQFPFIALLAPTAGQLAILYRHSGLITIDNLIHTLLVKLEDHAGLIHAMQAASQAASQADASLQDARTIRQTQDTEYEEALARDRELATQRAREEEEAREAARLAAEAAERERVEKEAEQARAEAEQRAREAKLAAIGVEPEPSPTVATVSVRLIDGSKVQRRFDASAKFGQVFDWIESTPSPAGQLTIRRARGDEVSTQGKHQVVSNFPRAVHSDPDALLSSAKLGKQAVLFVEEIITDDLE